MKIFKNKLKKSHKIILIAGNVLVFFLMTAAWLARPFVINQQVTYGATFAKEYAESLGLNWREAYSAVLKDFPLKNLRLPVFWNEIEKEPGKYNFDDIDWQINEARKAGVNIILALGRRVPRWPECFEPAWLKNKPESTKQIYLQKLLSAEVNHFKQFKNIKTWQVENEPFFAYFGECPKLSEDLLKEEVAIVKSKDNRPVMITDSGELNEWVRAAKIGDILGVTMYRQVGNKYTDNLYIRYPSFYYRLKLRIASIFSNDIQLVEFQAEPWTITSLPQEPIAKQLEKMNLDRVNLLLSVAKKSGFKEIYFWGVEWWYWLKIKGVPDFWEFGKHLNSL